MNLTSKFSMLAFAGSQILFGSLIPIGPVPSSGSGLGTVTTALTLTSPGSSSTESGCVAGGVGGATVLGASACPAQFAGGNEQAINNAYSAVELGLTDFSNLELIFNASEPGNAANRGLTLDLLALTLWNPIDGSILGAFYTTGPYVIADAFSGTGNSGFGFGLDAGQAGSANLLLAANPDLYIGVAANASSATGGLETVFLRVRDGGVVPPDEIVPEPSTYALVGLALTSISFWNRRRKS